MTSSSRSNPGIRSLTESIYRKYHDRSFIHFKEIPAGKGIRYLEPIISAIEEEKVLRVAYLPFYEDKPYYNEVHPYLLKEYGSRWYLVGWHEFKATVRTYALDRIRNLQEIPDLAYRAPAFDPAEYFRYTVGVIAPPGAPPLVKLAVQKTQAQYLITQPWHDSQNIHSEEEDHVVFSFRVHPTYEFKAMVLALGKDAEVLEPGSLRKELATELGAMLEKYR